MVVPILMPRQGQSVESCIISKWHKRKGDHVEVGEVLFTYETDKAAFEEESKVSGTLLDIFYEEGEDVPVLTNICVVGVNGDVSFQDYKRIETNEIPLKAADEQIHTKITHIESSKPLEDKLKISPRARNLAERTGVETSIIDGTGPYGRIIETDVKRAKDEAVSSALSVQAVEVSQIKGGYERDVEPPYTDLPLSNIRKRIAAAMLTSLTTTAQLTLNASFDASEVLDYIKKAKTAKDIVQNETFGINDSILFAVSRVITRHKEINSHFLDDKIRKFNNVNLGFAVDTDRGLIVPTIFGAEKISLSSISIEVRQLANEARSGSISPDKLKGASFTVTNLGAFGIETFTPVLNPPQTAILGVGAVVQRVKETDGVYSYYPSIGLSLTFDHRSIDGAPAARFLKDLKLNLENFTLLLSI